MNLFRRLKGNKGSDDEPPMMSLADEIREMAKREDAAARADDRSGLVAIYPELGASRRTRRDYAELDLDDYVPELDDYEPGVDGEYLPAEEPPRAVPQVVAAREAMVRAGKAGGDPATETAAAPRPTQPPQPQRATPAPIPPRAAPVATEPPGPPVDAAPVDLRGFVTRGPQPAADDGPALVQVPSAALGRAAGRRAGRVKTRLLGFDSTAGADSDPFQSGEAAQAAVVVRFPVGWIVVVNGPGRGASFTLFNGVSSIGRGDDQPVKLDFGDTSISRTNHAMVAYDSEQRKFFLGHGGKANIVRLNGRPVLSTEELNHNDLIRIGETSLRFLSLCGADFDWNDENDGRQGADANPR
jgi:hypothetical protein